jgi:hypothetical protein
VKVVIKIFKHCLLLSMILSFGCEDLYKSEIDYIDCNWLQYAEQQIYYCEDVSWCDESIYPNERVRRAWIYYIGTLPLVDNQLFTGGIDRIWYRSYKSDCVRYFNEENEIICNVIDEGGFKENIAGYLFVYDSQ